MFDHLSEVTCPIFLDLLIKIIIGTGGNPQSQEQAWISGAIPFLAATPDGKIKHSTQSKRYKIPVAAGNLQGGYLSRKLKKFFVVA